MPDLNLIPPPPSGKATLAPKGSMYATPAEDLPAPPSGKAVRVTDSPLKLLAEGYYKEKEAEEDLLKKQKEIDSLEINSDEKNWLKTSRQLIGQKLTEEKIFSEADWELSKQAITGTAKESDKAGTYYWDKNGLPKPLPYGQKPPIDGRTASTWGTAFSAADDNFIATGYKSLYNSFVDIFKVIPEITDLTYGLATDKKTPDWINGFDAWVDSFKFEKKEEAPVIDPAKIESWTDIFTKGDAWNVSLQSMANLIGSASGSILQFAKSQQPAQKLQNKLY